MDPALQRRVQRYGWDKAAASYERFWSAQLQPAQDRLLELAAIQPGDHVLDLGVRGVAVRASLPRAGVRRRPRRDAIPPFRSMVTQ
jgi:hypothetical protein